VPRPCIAVIPASAHGPAWLPCTSPRASHNGLCAAHYDAFVGVILGFQKRLKLPEHPFVDPRTLKRLYAKTKKTKRTRARRKERARNNQNEKRRRDADGTNTGLATPRDRTRDKNTSPKLDSRGTARRGGQACQSRARRPDQRCSAIEHTVTPPQEQNTAPQQEAQTQAAEAAIATRD
jgi:hypothetical protein